MTRRSLRSILPSVVLAPLLLACGDEARVLARDAGAEPAARSATAGGDAATADLEVGYRMGAADAPIAVVEFSDFGCPYCGRFATTTLRDLHRDYIEAGLVRWRYVPVSLGFAGGALMGAAAECAAELAGAEGFWRAHEVLYRHQTALRGPESADRMLGWLHEAGLDRLAMASCLSGPTPEARLRANNALAEEWRVRATPTFLVNGVPMSGAMPTEYFRKVFDTALDPSGL